ncbi:hypothetical protein PG985_003466 [Apiospora marii]|uniref:Uncharacterized protein n=1 Tax=Apiospora marii TaxID=335849 RepID=A0ABR1SHZ4_9PEZI
MASSAPAQSPDPKQGEGYVSRAPEPQTTKGIERARLSKKVHSKRPRVLFKTAGLHGSVKKPYFRRYKDSMREMRYGRPAKRTIGYLMMPKVPKSDKKDRNIKEQEQDPTEDMSDDGEDRGPDGPGSAYYDPVYELAKKVAAHAGREEVEEEDYEVLRKVYGYYERIQAIWADLS